MSIECNVRQFDTKLNSFFSNELIPSFNASRAVAHVIIAESHVECGQSGFLSLRDDTVDQTHDWVSRVGKAMIIVNIVFLITSFNARIEKISRIGRKF